MPHAETTGQLSLKAQREALRDGKILGLECAQCKHRTIIPAVRCPNGHTNLEVREFATEGKVLTYTIQNVASEAFLNDVPFAWIVVELDGGPRVSGWVPFVTRPEDLPAGQRVKFTPSYKPGMMFERA